MKFSPLYAISFFALSSALCVAGPGAGYSTQELSPSAQVDKTMNEFFGPNIYPSQEIIAKNAKYNVANKYSPTPQEIREETCKKIKGRIVSDINDETAKILNNTDIPPHKHSEIKTKVSRAAERDFDNAVYYNHEDGYARFMNGNSSIRQKARTLIVAAVFPN